MKKAILLHNPSAGEESYTKNELIKLIENEGINLEYVSIKDDNWDEFKPEVDFLIVAGGDGTVRNVSKKLIKDDLENQFPLAILPAGTANNIAKTLDISENEEEVIKSWRKNQIKNFDFGRVFNLPEKHFFLESFGLGAFPVLMETMKSQDKSLTDTPEKKIALAQKLLIEILNNYQPFKCSLEIDGSVVEGDYIMVEILNTQSIGPNLVLAPEADYSDGILEIALITEADKPTIINYISEKLKSIDSTLHIKTLKGKQIKVISNELLMHCDDELIKIENPVPINLSLDKNGLQFLI